MTCPACGAVNLPNARFCHQCATALATGGLAASPGTGMLPAQSLLANRYLILQKIGQGGMGAVYKATDTRLGQKIVALKELSESALTNPLDKQGARQAFEQEATMLALLSHPNLPRVTDHFSEGGKQYLVMDFIDGKTLEDLLNAAKGPLDVKQVVDWAGQLCDVLGYLHSRQPPVIFRDLKPGNIMLDRDGKIKLIDFGIARLFKAGKATDTTSFGTAGYAPPEQYGKGQTDARSDVYALGATLHHLLTGRDPGNSPFSFAPVCSLNPKAPVEVEAAIMKAVEQDVANRWQNAAQMKQALTAPYVAVPTAQPAPTRVSTPAPAARPKPAMLTPMGGWATLFLSALLAGLSWYTGRLLLVGAWYQDPLTYALGIGLGWIAAPLAYMLTRRPIAALLTDGLGNVAPLVFSVGSGFDWWNLISGVALMLLFAIRPSTRPTFWRVTLVPVIAQGIYLGMWYLRYGSLSMSLTNWLVVFGGAFLGGMVAFIIGRIFQR